MSWCLFVALGTRGDAAPLLQLALELQRATAARCVLLTHAAHREWVETSGGTRLAGLAYCNSSPYAREAADDGAALTGEQRVLVSFLQALLNSGRRPALMIFNLFALDAYHVAEAYGIRCIAASPYAMPHALPDGFLAWLRGTQSALYAALEAEDAARAAETTAGPMTSVAAARDARLSLADVCHWAYPLFNADRWRRLRAALSLAPLPGLVLPEETLAKRARAGSSGADDAAPRSSVEPAVSLPPAVPLVYLLSPRFLAPPARDDAADGTPVPPTVRAIGFVMPPQPLGAASADAASASSSSAAVEPAASVGVAPALAQPSHPLAAAASTDSTRPSCLCGSCRPLVVSLGSLPHMGIFEIDVDDDGDDDGGDDDGGAASDGKAAASASGVLSAGAGHERAHADTAGRTSGVDEATVLRFLSLVARAAAAARVPAIVVASGWSGFGAALAATGEPCATIHAPSGAAAAADASVTLPAATLACSAACRALETLVPGYSAWCGARQALKPSDSVALFPADGSHAARSGAAVARPAPAADDAALIRQHVFAYDGSVELPALLVHASAAVHHGGSGTTAACLQTGVPQVIVPFMFDQFQWAAQCAGIGVASAAPPLQELLDGDPDAQTAFVDAVVQACVPGGAIAAQAARVQANIAAEPDAAVQFIELAQAALAPLPPGAVLSSPFRIRRCGTDGDVELYEADMVDGLGCIVTPSLHELAFLHEELWRDDCYGLRPLFASWQATDAATERAIFDVGANIGVFHRMVACMAHAHGIAVRIVCVEPVALTHKLLLRNVQAGRAFDAYVAAPAAGGIIDTTCVQVAVFGPAAAAADADAADAAAVPEKLTMLTFPHMLGNSTAKPFEKRAALVKSFPDASVRGTLTAGSYAETVPCSTLSSLIDRYAARDCAGGAAAVTARAPAIDLLKIDVEGSEMEALRGITTDEHWSRIERVVVEVHDVGSRVADVERLLRLRFASVVVRPASGGDGGDGAAAGAAGGAALSRGPTHAVMVTASGPRGGGGRR